MKMYGVVDGRDFSEWVVAKARAVGKGLGEVLRDEASYVGETAAKITPPHSGSMSPSESWGIQKKAGQNAVRRDLGMVYISLTSVANQIKDRDEQAAKGYRSEVRKGNVREAQRILYSVGLQQLASKEIGPFDASLHSLRRDNRGRVTKNGRQQVVTDSATLNRYLRAELAKVGKLKKGWYLAGKRLPRDPKVAAWVRKATGGAGSLVDKSRKGLNPYVRLWNEVGYASGANRTNRFTSMAVRLRTLTLANKTKAMVRKKWNKRKR